VVVILLLFVQLVRGLLDNAAALFKMQYLCFCWSKFGQIGVNGDSNASKKRAGYSLLVEVYV